MEYFQKWYASKPEDVKQTVQSLVAAGHIEFAMSGLSSLATEGVLFEDIVTSVEQGARWLANEFGYRCTTFYSSPLVRVAQSEAKLLKDGGFEMLVVDGADPQWYSALQASRGIEFLWSTDEYLGAESRLFTHVSSALTEERWSVMVRVVNG